MPKHLVIVESPAKAKTIEGYLGKDFLVRSSYGHVRDLASKGISVRIDENFEPEYEVPADKKKLVAELKKLAKAAEIVWLASDEDREGEAIAWHLFQSLGLKKETTRRIVFNEITKTAILKAIDNPRQINEDLVNAQQARRVLDRLVGYELSPVLWKKVKPSLSAGRVQSVAVRLVVDRERERQAFSPETYFRVVAHFTNEQGAHGFKAELNQRPEDAATASEFLKHCTSASYMVSSLETKPAKRTPAAPFTTSTLQQEASRKLGLPVGRTMQLAQRLYESGKITYMRTDSVNLSDFARQSAAEVVRNQYGENYHKERQYSTKSKGAQEAHECIRPTNFATELASSDASEQRLYELIRKRALASQMADAQLEKTTAKIAVSGRDELFVARGEVIKFEGFLSLYLESTDDEDEDKEDAGLLPPMKEQQNLLLAQMQATQRFSQAPARYTEASLVKKLEELGIGRPSTYAPTISTIQKRGYVVKEEREGHIRKYRVFTLQQGEVKSKEESETTGAEKNKLFPTDIGMVVNDFLVEHFEQIMDYHFTARVEQEFDEIAEGKKAWDKMIESFYGPFHQTVKNTEENSAKATGKRLLGEEPKSGKPVYALVGRYGPMVQIGDVEDEEKPSFSSLQKGQSIQSIELQEALKLFALPRSLGDFEEKEVIVGRGRFGPYVRHNSKFVSIPKEEDPLEIDLERAVELIKAKREVEANRIIHDFGGDPAVQVLRGRYGPYISIGKENVRIPKDVEPEQLTREACLAIQKEAPKKKAKAKGSKK